MVYRTNTGDAKLSGRIIEVALPKTIEDIHDMILGDWVLEVR